MDMKNGYSLGCVEYGNNNFNEVMREGDVVGLFSHDDGGGVENPDGTYQVEGGMTVEEYIDEIKDRSDFVEILKELTILITKR